MPDTPLPSATVTLPGTVPAGDTPRLGKYELVRRLGCGGMAEVHLARLTGFEGFRKLVVIKRILPHLATDPELVRMFADEGAIAAHLDHPNVVQVIEVGTSDGESFIAMEYVYGQDLATVLRAARGRGELLPIEHATTIGIAVALGLHAAHVAVDFAGNPLRLVHRDVSPTNILVSHDGAVKVADFGIAKITARTGVTQVGIRKGKVPFMAPEQCAGGMVDRRTDVFSLGVVLYEATTGTRPFDGDNEFAIMRRIVEGPITPPSALRPGYPPTLERIVLRALARNPADRWESCAAMAEALESFACAEGIRATQAALAAHMGRMFTPLPFPVGALRPAAVPLATQDGGSWMWGGPPVHGEQTSHRVIGGLTEIAGPAAPMPSVALQRLTRGVVAAAIATTIFAIGAWTYRLTRPETIDAGPTGDDVAAIVQVPALPAPVVVASPIPAPTRIAVVKPIPVTIETVAVADEVKPTIEVEATRPARKRRSRRRPRVDLDAFMPAVAWDPPRSRRGS